MVFAPIGQHRICEGLSFQMPVLFEVKALRHAVGVGHQDITAMNGKTPFDHSA
jgi:hypothetical protein